MSTVDLSEPWRWACPECGSITIRSNAGNDRAPTLRQALCHGGRGEKVNFREPRDYHCKGCGAAFNQPVDRKEGHS